MCKANAFPLVQLLGPQMSFLLLLFVILGWGHTCYDLGLSLFLCSDFLTGSGTIWDDWDRTMVQGRQEGKSYPCFIALVQQMFAFLVCQFVHLRSITSGAQGLILDIALGSLLEGIGKPYGMMRTFLGWICEEDIASYPMPYSITLEKKN